MAVKVLMPKLGLTMKKGKITRWFKAEGQEVGKGEELAEIMTEKVTYKMEAQAGGILYKIVAGAGSVVPVAAPIAVIAEAGDSEAVLIQAVEEARDELARSEVKETKKAAPAARTEVVNPINLDADRKISPRALRLAREKGVDVGCVSGSGAEGRVVEQDVLRYIEETAKEREPQIIPMEGMRGAIAERMSESSRNAARVTIMQEVDITSLKALREKINHSFAARGKSRISYTDLLAAVVARSLKENPLLNARVSAEEIELISSVNLGIAVALDDGLIVPVVHQAHRLSLEQISEKIKLLAEKARGGGLEPAELQGGTFTISNLGMFGAEGFTPIINPPETAILGVGRIIEKPLLKEGKLERRLTMTLSLSFDHRAVDGAPAAMFLQRVKELSEEPFALFGLEKDSGPGPSLALGGHEDPRQIYNSFKNGMEGLMETSPDLVIGFSALSERVFFEDGEISHLNKELIAVALSVYMKCKYCITAHVYKALEAGATPEQILEAAGVAVFFGGGAAMAYTATLVQDCINAFKA